MYNLYRLLPFNAVSFIFVNPCVGLYKNLPTSFLSISTTLILSLSPRPRDVLSDERLTACYERVLHSGQSRCRRWRHVFTCGNGWCCANDARRHNLIPATRSKRQVRPLEVLRPAMAARFHPIHRKSWFRCKIPASAWLESRQYIFCRPYLTHVASSPCHQPQDAAEQRCGLPCARPLTHEIVC